VFLGKRGENIVKSLLMGGKVCYQPEGGEWEFAPAQKGEREGLGSKQLRGKCTWKKGFETHWDQDKMGGGVRPIEKAKKRGEPKNL